jgi:hypothetical protein
VFALVLSLAVALMPSTSVKQEASAQRNAALPQKGILVIGKSLAGVRLGDTPQRVRKLWGGNYQPCPKGFCTDPTWLYIYPRGEPLGAAVRFRNNRAIAVFTLGAVTGWRTEHGVTIADPASRVYELYGRPKYTKCIGFEALSLQPKGTRAVTSFYLTSGVVYGFALTVRGLNPCQ